MKTLEEIREEMSECGLSDYFNALAPLAKNSVQISLDIQDEDDIPLGSSKFGGHPDLPADMEWFRMDLVDIPMSFIAQINFAEVAPFDLEHKLPERGMLYFFYDLDEMPHEPSNLDAARVVYFGGDISQLHEMVLTDEDGESIAFAEQKIDFECVEEGYLSDSEPTHLLLGTPSLDYGTWYECIDGWQMLLQIDSFETEDAMINFTDEGVLCFYAEPDKIKKLDFSDVRIMQIYS